MSQQSPARILQTILLFACFLTFFSSAQAELMKTNQDASSYNEIQPIVETVTNSVGANHTLIVLDFDDTTFTMPNDIGGAAWFDWQSALLKNQPESKQLVAHSFSKLLSAQKKIFSLYQMDWTEPELPKLIDNWQAQKIKVMIATARSPEFAKDTTQELEYHHFKPNALYAREATTSVAPFNSETCNELSKRPTAYESGVAYLSGQNKGGAINCLLNEKKHNQIKAVIFVDDTRKNTNQVCAHDFSDNNLSSLTCIHYTHFEKKQQDFWHNTQRQQQAVNTWEKIKKSEAKVHS